MPRQDKVFVCFQKAEDDTHKLYIYDDVTACCQRKVHRPRCQSC